MPCRVESGGLLYYPGAFWLEPSWRDVTRFSVDWLLARCQTSDVVLLVHPENVLAIPTLGTDFLRIITRTPKQDHPMSTRNDAPAILMIAYTYYQSDPRVIREAEAALHAGFSVDFLALRRPGDPPQQYLRGVRIFHLPQSRYRGAGARPLFLSYVQFLLRCFLKTTILALRRRYRIVHVNNMPDFLVFSTVVAKLLGAKVVLDIHDPMPTMFLSKFRGGERSLLYHILLWQELVSARYADRVIPSTIRFGRSSWLAMASRRQQSM